MNSLSNVGCLVLVLAPDFIGKKDCLEHISIVCMSKEYILHNSEVRRPDMNFTVHWDPFVDVSICGCGNKIEDCRGVFGLCAVRKAHLEHMYYR